MDLSCRQLTGAQAIADIDVKVVEDLVVPRLDLIDAEKLVLAYSKISHREILPRIADEYSQGDRRELDRVIFDSLGLTNEEAEEIYFAVIDLVTKRLQKAKTITGQ